MSKPLIFHRSAATTDWACPRKRYWNYEHDGRGVSPPETQIELYLGTLIHDGVYGLVQGHDIDTIVKAGVEQLRTKLLEGRELDADAQHLADEQCALAEGMLRGFNKAVWPGIRAQYPDVVLVEKELVYDYKLAGQAMRFLAKPDLVLRGPDGLVYFEWKTTSSNKEEWIHQWETAVQLHSACRAIEAQLGEPVTQVIVQGFYKSYVSQYNRLESIFCYGYHSPGNPPFEKARWAYDWKNGMRKAPTWQRDGGVRRWIEEMPPSLLASQFPQTPPIFVNERLVEAFFRQQGLREQTIRDGREWLKERPEDAEQIMDSIFPQHWDSCNMYNRPCPYKRLCFGAPVDPLTIGFTPRYSHHPLEQAEIDAKDTDSP